MNISLSEFINRNKGKPLDWDKKYGGQCVDLYRYYVNDVLGYPQTSPVVGAYDLYEASDSKLYTKILNTPEGVPQKGDIIIWTKKAGKGFGHVAVFIEGNNKKFKSFDQNWRALNVCEITNHTYTNVYGWLRPKTMSQDIDPTKELPESFKEVSEFKDGVNKGYWKVKDAFDSLLFKVLTLIDKLIKEKDLKDEAINVYKSNEAILQAKIKKLEKDLANQLSAEEYEKTVDTLTSSTSRLNTENDNLKKQIEELKESSTKEWYMSKTLWINVASILVILVQILSGEQIPGITPELQSGILAIANIILRIITKKGVTVL